MNQSFNFEKLDVYQYALSLATTVYSLTQSLPREHLFGITDQLRRATTSISLNIAEGSSRSQKDFNHFLSIARGSCFECIPLIGMAKKLNLISQIQYDSLYSEYLKIAQMLSKLRTSLQQRRINQLTK